MKSHQHPVDERPFRSKADQAREHMLEEQYHHIALRDVAAAVQPCPGGHAAGRHDDDPKR